VESAYVNSRRRMGIIGAVSLYVLGQGPLSQVLEIRLVDWL
jgi:hypothetical protein